MNKLILCLLLATAGCAQMSIVRRAPSTQPAPTAAQAPVVLEDDSYLWGLAGRKVLDDRIVCGPGGADRLELGMSTRDVLLTTVTLGIYVPHHARFFCAKDLGSNKEF